VRGLEPEATLGSSFAPAARPTCAPSMTCSTSSSAPGCSRA